MPAIEYRNIDDPELADLVATIRSRRSSGKVLNLDRMLLHSPPFARGWNAMFAAIRSAHADGAAIAIAEILKEALP